MKKMLTLIVCLALCATLAACSSRAVNTDNTNGSPSPAASEMVPETPLNTPASTPTQTPAGVDQNDELYAAYSDALNTLVKTHKLPDGTDAAELTGDMANNKFALHDVDNDGKVELLLMYTDTYMAGQTGYVFAYDEQTKKLNTELSEFPLLTFYDNGAVKAEWSHNQGRAGENFWPYSLYQYAPETDSYALIGMVDAWDKTYAETDDQNNPFPSDIDKSGTGIVYYIMENGEYDTTHPIDASDYNAWVSTHIANASQIQIQYMDLTEENILQITNA